MESAESALPLNPHVHTVTCNHTSAPAGEVTAAVRRRDAAAVQKLIADGNTTEERDEVSLEFCCVLALLYTSQLHNTTCAGRTGGRP